MCAKQPSVWFMGVIGWIAPCLSAESPAPELTHLYPLAGQRGSVIEVRLNGTGLEGAYSAWFGLDSKLYSSGGNLPNQTEDYFARNSSGLGAQIQSVTDDAEAVVRVHIDPQAQGGVHMLHLVTPGGVSNGLSFWVSPHKVFMETDEPHDTPDQSLSIVTPVDINGRITALGQLDHYAFEIDAPQTLKFDLIAFYGSGFDPHFTLYDSKASWLDPRRSNRLLFREEQMLGVFPPDRQGTYRFEEPGRYVIIINSIFARSGKDFSYLLRITPAQTRPPPSRDETLAEARSRLEKLHSDLFGPPDKPIISAVPDKKAETVARSSSSATSEPDTASSEKNDEPAPDPPEVMVASEREGDDTTDTPVPFTLPAVLEGTVDSPGDVDVFSFAAPAAQEIVLEIATPVIAAPIFNLRLTVLDSEGQQVFTNLEYKDWQTGQYTFGKLNACKSKITAKLEKAGTYRIRIEDLSELHGAEDFRYRVFVRQPVPHISAVRVEGMDRINLATGTALPINVATVREEGYAGDFAVKVTGLPQGVSALFGAADSTVVLIADPNAPATVIPEKIQFSGFPVENGRTGIDRVVQELPLMVVNK